MKRGSVRATGKYGSCERAIRDYFGGILRGDITACGKMKQVAAIVLQGMDNTDPLYPYHYRGIRAEACSLHRKLLPPTVRALGARFQA